MTITNAAAMMKARLNNQRVIREAAAALSRFGARFESRRQGAHFVIHHAGKCFDLWPTTGRWRQRDNKLREGSLSLHSVSLKSGDGLAGLLVELAQS